MDTALSNKAIASRRYKTVGVIFLALLAIVAAIWFLRLGLTSSVDRSKITTAIVEIGNIDNTVNASGEVVPEFEQVISSPISAAIEEVFLDAGAMVKGGDVILSLDKEATEEAYGRLKFLVESKRNAIAKLKLDLAKTAYDTKSANEIKQLNISSLESAVEDAKRLFKAGGGTRESVEQAELALKVANLEKARLENEIRSKQLSTGVDIREAQIAAAIEESGLNELNKKLQQASITAKREGVITWVNKNIGSTIAEGEALARIADLGSFKIKGNISDAYLDQVKLQMQVVIRVGDSTLQGVVSNINPSIQNGIVAFDVAVDQKNSLLLRPNMKVELFLVTSSQDNILRVRNGSAFKGGATQDIFVIKGDKAIRKTVNTGFSNFDFVQIKSGVQQGDEVIISDMKDYINLEEIQIHKKGKNEN